MAFIPLGTPSSLMIELLLRHLNGARIHAIDETGFAITGVGRVITDLSYCQGEFFWIGFGDGSRYEFDCGLWIIGQVEPNKFVLVRNTPVMNLIPNDPPLLHYTITIPPK